MIIKQNSIHFIFLNIHSFGQITMNMIGLGVSKTNHKEFFLRLKGKGIFLFPCLRPISGLKNYSDL